MILFEENKKYKHKVILLKIKKNIKKKKKIFLMKFKE